MMSWFPKTDIPPFNYLSRISDEFHRRQEQAEVDEVEQWKKALTETDSYALQEMLHNPANRDHMKAIITLLAERGRVDWMDEETVENA